MFPAAIRSISGFVPLLGQYEYAIIGIVVLTGSIWIGSDIGIVLVVCRYREYLRIRAIILATCGHANVENLILSIIVGIISKIHAIVGS